MVYKSSERCPYYEAKIVAIPMPTTALTLTIPICRLAHIMGERLNTIVEGQSISLLLTTTPIEGQTRFLYGPDLNPITASLRLCKRLYHACEPEFGHILTRLHLDPSLPKAEEGSS